MKKRTAIIGALVSLLPMGQPLLIGTGAVLTSAALIISVPEKAMAESARSYLQSAQSKYESKDYDGSIYDLTQAIEINPNYSWKMYFYRGMSRSRVDDNYGAISDFTKGIELKPDQGLLYLTRSVVKYKLGDKKGFCSDLNQAINRGTTGYGETSYISRYNEMCS